MKIKSKLYRLNFLDIIKGFILAFFVGSLTALLQFLNPEAIGSINFKIILTAGASPAVLYLLGKLGTNSKGELFKKENDDQKLSG